MNIRKKFFMAFGLVVLLFLTTIGFLNLTISKQNNKIIAIKDNDLQSSLIAVDLQQTLSNYQLVSLLGAVGYSSKENMSHQTSQLSKHFTEQLHRYRQINQGAEKETDTLLPLFEQFKAGDQKAGEEITLLISGIKNSNIERIQTGLDEAVESNWRAFKQAMSFQAIIIIIVVTLCVYFSDSITRPIRRLIKGAKVISEGRLTDNLYIKSKDEFGKLAEIFEKMRLNLADFIRSSQNTTLLVLESADKLTQAMIHSERSIDQINQSIQEIELGALNQLQSTQECVQAVEEMTRGVAQITSSTSVVADNSILSERESENGKVLIEKVLEHAQELKNTITNCADSLKLLEKRSIAISEVVILIKSVASQTNLLALNASIEAARAGEQGRGFEVVASEIRKMSLQVTHSSNHIWEIVSSVQENLVATVNQMELGQCQIEQTEESILEANAAFETIMSRTMNISKEIQEISSATQEMQAGTQQVNASIQHLAAIAGQSYKGSQDAVDQSRYQHSIIKENNNFTCQLRESAADLQATITAYKV